MLDILDYKHIIYVNHYILQVYYYSIDAKHPLTYKSNNTQHLLKHVRHGGVFCFVLLLWIHPYMTSSRLLLASSWSLYLLLAHRVTDSDYTYLCGQVQAKRQYLHHYKE